MGRDRFKYKNNFFLFFFLDKKEDPGMEKLHEGPQMFTTSGRIARTGTWKLLQQQGFVRIR